MENNYEKTILQLQHQIQMKEKRDALRERKARTHRLIVRGAIVESLFKGSENMSDEAFQKMLLRALGRDENEKHGYPQDSHGSAPRESARITPGV